MEKCYFNEGILKLKVFCGKCYFHNCVNLLGHCNKTPQTGSLEQQTFIISHFWRLEVQSQNVGGFIPSEGSKGRICYGAPFLAGV